MAAQNASSGDIFDLRPRGARLHHAQSPPWYATNDSIAFAGACPNTTRRTARQREYYLMQSEGCQSANLCEHWTAKWP
jgi:hypothetical protein